jgi:hypothetical protein
MSRLSALALTTMLVLSFAAPATAANLDICKHRLATAFASMDAARVSAKSARLGDDSCAASRRHFLETVKARAVAAQCKSGGEREQELGKLDRAVETLNGLIAARCGS